MYEGGDPDAPPPPSPRSSSNGFVDRVFKPGFEVDEESRAVVVALPICFFSRLVAACSICCSSYSELSDESVRYSCEPSAWEERGALRGQE